MKFDTMLTSGFTQGAQWGLLKTFSAKGLKCGICSYPRGTLKCEFLSAPRLVIFPTFMRTLFIGK